MSYDLVVYLKRENMPSTTAWHSSILEAGFPAKLDSDFDVDSFAGFLPCPVNGEISGFEYYSSTLSPEEAEELEAPSGSDFSIQFCIGSRPLELVSALAASSVLAAISGGVLNDPQAGENIPSENAVAWAKSQLAESRA
jgi:hypothetical protein